MVPFYNSHPTTPEHSEHFVKALKNFKRKLILLNQFTECNQYQIQSWTTIQSV